MININNKEILENNSLNEQVKLASRWARLFASIIDSILVMIIMFISIVCILYFTEGIEVIKETIKEPSTFYTNFNYMIGLMILLDLFIFSLLNVKLLIKNGQTIGKKIFKIKIVDLDNILPNKLSLSKRYTIYLFIQHIPIIGSILHIINLLFIFGKEKRCIHDRIANTKVIKCQLI